MKALVKVKEWWNSIRPDHKKHFAVGLVVGFVMTLLTSWLVGLIVALLAGLVKEAFDKYDKDESTHFEVSDFIWTARGGFAGVVIAVAALLLF